jgi:hypothetical protein
MTVNDKGPLLAEGRTAEVYAWGEDQILKLYRPGWSRRSAENEYRKALASQETGFAVPAVGELVTVDERAGISYQRVDGVSMWDDFAANPLKLLSTARSLAALQVDMHSRQVGGLPMLHDALKGKIERAEPLDRATKNTLLDRLSRLPRESRLCHGDFHPANILITSDRPVIIDWVDATSGHPLGDVARTLILATTGHIPKGTPGRVFFFLLRRLFRQIYIRQYFKLSPYNQKDLYDWLPVIAAARLEENIKEENENLLVLVRKYL